MTGRFTASWVRYACSLLIALFAAHAAPQSDAASPRVERVTRAFDGGDANGPSIEPSISGNGSRIAFVSYASNLAPGDTNGREDYFVFDRPSGMTRRISVSSLGEQAVGPREHIQPGQGPAISTDGQAVAFSSAATNLVPGDTNGVPDIFVHDLDSGTTARVSVGVASQADRASLAPSIDGIGRWVAFQSAATNLVPGDANGKTDVFVHDTVTGETELVSVGLTGQPGNGFSGEPSISKDGRFVAFESESSDLVEGDTNGRVDVFVRDRDLGITVQASVATDGTRGDLTSMQPAISPSGTSVAFSSNARNLVFPPGLGQQVYLHQLDMKETTHVSEGPDGLPLQPAYRPSVSEDGGMVSFEANRLSDQVVHVFDPWKIQTHVYARSLIHGTTELISVGHNGQPANGNSFASTVSADGRIMAFQSSASDLVVSDSNGVVDVFVCDVGRAH